jgi:hypothetical protein
VVPFRTQANCIAEITHTSLLLNWCDAMPKGLLTLRDGETPTLAFNALRGSPVDESARDGFSRLPPGTGDAGVRPRVPRAPHR